MALSEVIGAASAIAAMASALATSLTVREIAKQRRASYRPELVIPTLAFTMHPSQLDAGIDGLWHRNDSSDDAQPATPTADIVNIGLGAAKQVKAVWACPTETMVEAISKAKAARDSTIAVKLDRSFLKLDIEGGGSSYIAPSREEAIDVIMPASREHTPSQLRIPLAYVAASTAMLRAGFDAGTVLLPPPLGLAVSYCDIADNEVTLAYELEFDFIAGTATEIQFRLAPQRVVTKHRALKRIGFEPASLSIHETFHNSLRSIRQSLSKRWR